MTVSTEQRAVGNHELRNGFGGRAIAGVDLKGGNIHGTSGDYLEVLEWSYLVLGRNGQDYS